MILVQWSADDSWVFVLHDCTNQDPYNLNQKEMIKYLESLEVADNIQKATKPKTKKEKKRSRKYKENNAKDTSDWNTSSSKCRLK